MVTLVSYHMTKDKSYILRMYNVCDGNNDDVKKHRLTLMSERDRRMQLRDLVLHTCYIVSTIVVH